MTLQALAINLSKELLSLQTNETTLGRSKYLNKNMRDELKGIIKKVTKVKAMTEKMLIQGCADIGKKRTQVKQGYEACKKIKDENARLKKVL